MSWELQSRGRAVAADLIDVAFNCHAIELLDRQRDEKLDPVFERNIGVAEGPPQLSFGPLGSGRIGHAPMGGYRIARPNRAHFAAAWSQTVKTKSMTGAPGRANSCQ